MIVIYICATVSLCVSFDLCCLGRADDDASSGEARAPKTPFTAEMAGRWELG